MSHTPGPWLVFEPDKSLDAAYPGIDAEAHSIVVYGQDDVDDGGVKGATREQARANARLIAAAPDLLNMLQQARTMLSAYGSQYDACHIALMDDIDAALTKAGARQSEKSADV